MFLYRLMSLIFISEIYNALFFSSYDYIKTSSNSTMICFILGGLTWLRSEEYYKNLALFVLSLKINY